MITIQEFLSRFRKIDVLKRKAPYRGDGGGYRYHGSRDKFLASLSSHFDEKDVELTNEIFWSRAEGGASDENPTGVLRVKDSTIKIVFNKTLQESADVISNQKLSYIAECAAANAIGHSSHMSEDVRLSVWYNNLEAKQKSAVDKIYESFLALACNFANLLPEGVVQFGSAGDPQAKVDITLSSANSKFNLHVKFNDPNRFFGLQAGTCKVTKRLLESNFEAAAENVDRASALYKLARNEFAKDLLHFLEIPAISRPVHLQKYEGQNFLASTDGSLSCIERLSRSRWMNHSLELEIFKNDVLRAEYLQYLRRVGLPDKIIAELKHFLGRSGEDRVYFLNYASNPRIITSKNLKSLSLSISELRDFDASAIDLKIEDNLQSRNTVGYFILLNGQRIFDVELRTSGSRHPLQIKKSSNRCSIEDIVFHPTVKFSLGVECL